jgi:bifunctional enzyme CysN/CysC
MSHQSDLISDDIDAYLAQHERKELLRLLTCGNVDDGKSTLIGRLLHDSKMIYEDQLASVKADSVKSGTTGGEIDLALLVDGLQAEREQGITIDVAYRYFSTSRRKFIIADTPGHEQYTRNMATGASNCDLAIILIDARHGVLTQTRRHSFIASLLGIKHIIVAVNKMDLMDYSEETYENIKKDYLDFASNLEKANIQFIPLSALKGDNVVSSSDEMPWYKGKPLMEILETVEISNGRNLTDFRFPVQYVNRPNLNFRGYCGTIAAGIIRKGDTITTLPSGKTSTVKSIVTYDGELEEAFAPMAITLTLDDEIDVSRGDLIAKSDNQPETGNRFKAKIVWMVEQPLTPGKQYYIKLASKMVSGSVSKLHHRIDVNTLEKSSADALQLNEIGLCDIAVNAPVAFDPYSLSKGTGAFIIIDRLTNITVGAGMIVSGASDSDINPVSEQDRIARYGQKAITIRLTGDKKQEIATQLERRLFDMGHACLLLDAQQAELAAVINQAGLICLVVAETNCAALTLNCDTLSLDEIEQQVAEQAFIN